MDTAIEILQKASQPHIVDKLRHLVPQKQTALIEQVIKLDKSYPGGLSMYVQRARNLLKNSKENVNPYQGYKPQVPVGYRVDFQSQQIWDYQQRGLKQLDKTAFVLVAGGLGERLGYKGIKVQLPVDLLTGKCFLEYYIDFLKEYQSRFFKGGKKIQLAIMTSEDTHLKTLNLLEKNAFFGLEKHQIHLMMQEKVPAILNNDALFSFVDEEGLIQTKPHGHGDVHTLLYQHQLTFKWLKQGFKWVFFFQDTNPLVFRALTSVLGVSDLHNLKINSVTVPRKPGQAVGAIMSLKRPDRQLTINVQYNQLESLLKPFGGEPTDKQGFSLYPGNINALIFQLSSYAGVLQKTKGNIDQFINPKYKDHEKNFFKSSTRLECMMQDFPKLLDSNKGVGFSQVDRFFCFSTLKNDIKSAALKFKDGLAPESAGSCQADLYSLNRKLLTCHKCKIEKGEPVTFNGITLDLFPRIHITPKFGLTINQIIQNIKGSIQIAPTGELILDDVSISDLKILEGERAIVKQGKVEKSKGAKLVESNEADPVILQMRGFKQTFQ